MARSAYLILLVFASALICGNAQDNSTTTATPAPNSTTTVTPTTTPAPTPTPTPSPTPTPLPTADPSKEPAVVSYNVSDANHTRYCLLAHMGVRMDFMYTSKDNKNLTLVYDLPETADGTNSDCGVMLNSTETLVFDFFDDWKLTMEFKYNATSKMWYGSEVSLSFNYDNTYFPNATGPSGKQVAKLSNQTLFMVNNGSSFQCVSQSPLSDFSGLPKDFQMNITTTNLRVEAFRGINNTDFAMSTPCRADTAVSNIVPIAVGCALAGLVVIVLIAYLIGRKRSKRGYESV